ncbi:MAG: methyltransferase domain-containing protein [Rhodospirillales bacterium]|nr:methyltransferase domain-containing protein [Rhodospirillales bacterium]
MECVGRWRWGMKRQRGDRDRGRYEAPQIVSSDGRNRQLQPPEQTLLDELGPDLGRMEMLDLGVGAGRTAWHFAPQAKSYLGLDYARTMVERCQHDLPAYRFIVGNASDLERHPNVRFHFTPDPSLVAQQSRELVFHPGARRAQMGWRRSRSWRSCSGRSWRQWNSSLNRCS